MTKLFVIVAAIATIVFISFVLAWPVMMLWNYCLIGAVTGFNEIGWLQAWGISVLTGLLFNTSSISK